MSTHKPIILTTVSHQGVSALDLSTVPHHLLVNIATAAMAVSAEWGNGTINTEYLGAEQALNALSTTSSSLDQFFTPTVPGREDLLHYGFTITDHGRSYPVLRNNQIHMVKAADLTAIEMAAVRQHLELNIRSGQESAESFKARLAQFMKEICPPQTQEDSGYVEAPAPDWRLA